MIYAAPRVTIILWLASFTKFHAEKLMKVKDIEIDIMIGNRQNRIKQGHSFVMSQIEVGYAEIAKNISSNGSP